MSYPRRSDDEHARAHPGAGDRPAVQTAADVQRLLGEQITQLAANRDLDPLKKARQLAQLALVTLRAIELATLEARLEAVETVLRRRKKHPVRKETTP